MFIETNVFAKSFLQTEVISIFDLEIDKIDIIYMANSYVDTLYACLECGVPKEKIIIENETMCQNYFRREGKLDIKYDYNFMMQYVQNPEFVVMRSMQRRLKIYDGSIKRMLDTSYVESMDYCRYATLELIIEQIKENKVIGDLAELGVFRGEFSKHLNSEFPDRKLYLFDTFEGFAKEDVDIDIAKGYSEKQLFGEVNNFEDTSVDLVLGKMRYRDSVHIRKGYFPDTIPQEEITYALVSIDCDLYVPILEGLRYFYPRVNSGGYIMIHDYNTIDLKGVKHAVYDYEREIKQKIVKVPISDINGSLIIAK